MLEIDYIQSKINRLKVCQDSGAISNIIISFDAGPDRKILMQYDTDISLVNEIRLLFGLIESVGEEGDMGFHVRWTAFLPNESDH